MTKIKTNPLLIFYSILALVVFTGADDDGEDLFFKNLTHRFNTYIKDYNVERAYVFTDRFVYRPGENIWFKGYAVSPGKETSSTFSEDFFIRLVNHKGEEIIFRRYPLTGNETSGRLLIPRSCIPGKYLLIAYTGWMKNRCPQEAFRKEILVSRYYEKRLQTEIFFNRNSYVPGDTMTAHVRIYDQTGKHVSETYYDYSIGTLNKTEMKGSGKSDIKGKSRIDVQIPKTDDLLVLTVHVKTGRLSGSSSAIIPVITDHPLVAFFPEGGKIIKGIENHLVFRVTDKYGMPQIRQIRLVDEKNTHLASAVTNSSGLGEFNYIPGNDSLFLQIENPDTKPDRFMLPVAREDGSVIRLIHADEKTVSLKIQTSHTGVQKTYWAGIMNNRIVWTRAVEFVDNTIVSINAAEIGTGIMQLSVFDAQNNLLTERLISIESPVQPLRIKMDKLVFQSRQRVSLIVEYKSDLINSNMALAVSLKNLIKKNDQSDFENVLYSKPCEEGYLDKGFNSGNNLDLLLSDFRYVDWNAIFQKSASPPYTKFDGLWGRVYDKKENVSQHAKVRVTHFPNFRFYETQTDENGRFHIQFGNEMVDYKFLNIEAYDALGKINLNAFIDDPYARKAGLDDFNDPVNSEKQKIKDLLAYGEPDLIYVLRYGPGKFKSSKESPKKYDPYKYANYTDILDIIQDIKPYQLIENKIIFSDRDKNRTDTTGMDEAVFVINGKLKGTNIGVLNNILPSDITNINISGSLLDVHKYTPLNFGGVIEITTIQGLYRYRQSHSQWGSGTFNNERDFYSPDYSVEASYSPDNRKTLYWNPKISLQSDNLVLITFYTSDIKGTFTGHITGIDSLGNPIEGEFTFRVE